MHFLKCLITYIVAQCLLKWRILGCIKFSGECFSLLLFFWHYVQLVRCRFWSDKRNATFRGKETVLWVRQTDHNFQGWSFHQNSCSKYWYLNNEIYFLNVVPWKVAKMTRSVLFHFTVKQWHIALHISFKLSEQVTY